MASEQDRLAAAISALEAQRGVLGDAVVEASLEALRFKLAAADAGVATSPAQTLRQVSILFLDIVGSTRLSQRLDPETIHHVMDGALERCTLVVAAHGGRVLQYAGDNLLGVFGADGAGEDDAERAVRCGLALLALGRELGEAVRRAHRHEGFDVRVGVHTGGVLLGGGVDAEGSIRGIAVNIAARMEQTAPAGALRISRDTHRLLRDRFETGPQEALRIKGVDGPVWTCLVLRERPRVLSDRGTDGAGRRMVGRDAELGRLQQAREQLVSTSRLSLVSLVGEAGIGKTRLLEEFGRWSGSRRAAVRVLKGSAYPQTRGRPYGLLLDIVQRRFVIGDDDTADAASRKLEQALLPLFASEDDADLAEAHCHLFGHLIGVGFDASRHVLGIRDDPGQLRSRAFHAGALAFRRLWEGRGERALLLLEDLQWADDGSLDFLEHVADVNRDLPMLIVATTRATLFERRQLWQGAPELHQRIDLAPLSPQAAERLADDLLHDRADVPAEVRAAAVDRAEGNPFYLEELLGMLVDERPPGAEAGRPAAMRLPTTLVGVLQARLDALPAAEKLALQQASVIGHVFWDRALAALDRRAQDLLPALARRGLALPRDASALEAAREYAFRQQVLHQVTYDTVLRRERRDWHRLAAQWLAERAEAGAGDLPALTAWHFEMGDDKRRAAEFHGRAAEHARQRFAHPNVLDHVRHALALLDEGDGAAAPDESALLLRWRLLDVRERTLDLLGSRAEQRADIDALRRLADAQADDRRRADVAWRCSDIAFRTADHPAQRHWAQQALTLAERVGDDDLRLRALHCPWRTRERAARPGRPGGWTAPPRPAPPAGRACPRASGPCPCHPGRRGTARAPPAR